MKHGLSVSVSFYNLLHFYPLFLGLEFLMACGNRLISPKLRAGQELDANLIHKVYKSKALYTRPSIPQPILDDITGYSSEDNICEENAGSARQLRSSSLTGNRHSHASSDGFTSRMTASPPTHTSAVQLFASSPGCEALVTQTPALTYQSSISTNQSTSQPSTSSFGGTPSADPTPVLTCLNSSSSPYQSSTPASLCSVLPSTSTHHQSANYDNYLSVMAALSDMSCDDEELNQAILASLQSERRTTGSSVPVSDIFARSCNKNKLSEEMESDDMGVPEKAVDLGGPRRAFLRLLMEALPLSPMFEGESGKMNLAFDSTGHRMYII
ncbi:putative protein TPRXL [Epinephelus fuscoguttatus]|uniref:putative protein TPRXL n=1 Tax=Epinephelus fuscoguttatus TaxID=293821 RepID=UPI0020D05CA0|nr:putative protein TPRXL [Epinephelus fuscoguttatus]XP_049446683.1 putative protein TPRXL [Epinephelus fuscoguttatus]